MAKRQQTPRHDLAVLLGLLILLLFASPLTGWLARLDLPWFSAYALWGVIVFLGALLARSNRRDGT
jgi:hypothetical protein